MIRMARVGVDLHQRPRRPGQLRPRASTSPATWRTSARAPPTTSATSSPSPTSGRSCTSARPTAATRCSARSRTACGRPPTTAGPRGEFLAEQFMLIGITDKRDRPEVPRLRRLPERLRQDQPRDDARPRRRWATATTWSSTATTSPGCGSTPTTAGSTAINPEFGVFGVAKDTNESTNPTALESIGRGHRDALHQRRLQRARPRRSGGRARRRSRPPTSPAGATGTAS